MKFAFIVPYDKKPLMFVGHGHFACDAVQQWVNVLDGDIWQGEEIADHGVFTELNRYDVVMVNANTSMVGLICHLKSALEHPKILMLDGGSVDDICIVPTHIRQGFIAAIRACDMYCTFQPWAHTVYELLTDKPIRYIGIPTPVRLIRSYRKPWSQRRKRVAVGIQLGPGGGTDRNGLLTVFALRKVLGPEWEIDIAYTDPIELSFAQTFGLNLTMHPVISPQNPYWENISDCRFGIMLDLRYTWGRFASNMAGLGIPCIGVARNGTQERLFPSLTVADPFKSMGAAVDMVRALAADDTGMLSAPLCDYADAVLDAEFDEPIAKARFMAAVAELGVT